MNKSIEITSANIIQATIESNGYHGGDAGHGGFVSLEIKDLASTCMDVEVDRHMGDLERVKLTFRGDCEKETLLTALRFFVKALEEERGEREEPMVRIEEIK